MMIKKTSNKVLIKSSNVTFAAEGKPKSVPSINSLVTVSVVRREGHWYRILVNGSLFQTKLPFLLEKGEEFLAKVLTHKPFSLALDGLTATKEIEQNVLLVMLARLGIEESELSKKILKMVIKNKKPLIKSKLKRVIAYLNSLNIHCDEIQTEMLLNIIWSTDEKSSKELLTSFNRIFDISFEELSKRILNSLERLSTMDSENEIVKKFNEILIYQPENTSAKSNISAVMDKSKNFIELSQMIDFSNDYGQMKSELIVIQTLMMKYILQKSMFNMFKTYPEFIVVNSNNVLEMIIVRYDKLPNTNGELLYKIKSGFHINNLGDFDFISYLSNIRLSGDLMLDFENLKRAESKLNSFNNELSGLLKVDSAVRITLRQKFKQIGPNRVEGISSINAIA